MPPPSHLEKNLGAHKNFVDGVEKRDDDPPKRLAVAARGATDASVVGVPPAETQGRERIWGHI